VILNSHWPDFVGLVWHSASFDYVAGLDGHYLLYGEDPDHFDFLMTLCQRGADKFGNSFTYTLLESKEFNG